MKKYSIVLMACLFMIAAATSSCSRKCKGGGWYGDRNLGYTPTKEKPTDNVKSIISEETELDCTIVNP